MRLTDRKLELLRQLAGGESTPTALADTMDLTISSVTKHLQDLEDGGLVTKSGKKKGKTRSFWQYKVKEFAYLLTTLDGEVRERQLELKEHHKVHLRIWSLPQVQFQKCLEQLWCQLQEHLADIDGLLVYGSVARGEARDESDIDLLFVSDEQQLEEKYGARVVGGKMVMTTVIAQEEFKNKLQQGSQFATNMIEEGVIIYDPTDFLRRLQNEH